MATVMILFFVLILQTISLLNAAGPPVIDVHPAEIQVGHTDTLDVVCTFHSHSTSNMAAIVALALSRAPKAGQTWTELATVTSFSPHDATLLTSTNVTAAGFLNPDGESYLHLKWEYPSDYQAGLYQCSARGIDATGHNVVEENTAEVKLIQGDLDICLDTVSEMRKNMSAIYSQVTRLEQIIADMENHTKSLERKLAENENYTKALEETLATGGRPPMSLAEFGQGMTYRCHSYYISKDYVSDDDNASAVCQRNGGHLAEINDALEYHALQDFLSNATGLQYILIAGNDKAIEGQWILPSDGSMMPILDWAPGEPGGGDTDCLALAPPTWQMFDVICYRVGSSNFHFMCEWD